MTDDERVITIQDSEQALAAVVALADELADWYADDELVMQTMVQGIFEYAERQRMHPHAIADEFLLHLRDWIRQRNAREDQAGRDIERVSRESS